MSKVREESEDEDEIIAQFDVPSVSNVIFALRAVASCKRPSTKDAGVQNFERWPNASACSRLR